MLSSPVLELIAKLAVLCYEIGLICLLSLKGISQNY
jgi:hypothetical protein